MLRNALLIVLAALAGQLACLTPAVAQSVAPGDSAESGAFESQQFARQRLLAMATYLSGLEKFSVNIRAGYDVLQGSGQMIEFGELRKLAVQRPDRARIEQNTSDGRHNLLMFDGADITAFDGESRSFAQTAQPADLDTALMYLQQGLQLRLPLAPLLMSRFPQELERRVLQADFVETTDILGIPADHIAARTDAVDFQAWIAEGEQPWPLRIVLTYRLLEGSPQFWANMSDWDASPTFATETFVFAPAADMTRIPFAAHFSTMPQGPQTHGAAALTGEK